jgi:predicted TIM-barrel fold metal-dependent hydrolase
VDVPGYWQALGLPGLADIHVHFLPEAMLHKVWAYFDRGEEHYGQAWPVHYRMDEAGRLDAVRQMGLRAIPALSYAHKPGMAAWLNEWSAGFADGRPAVLQSATFYPEPEAPAYVAEALDRGARIFKVHVQVGRYDPRDPLLAPVWARLEETGTPVVIHCGSGPLKGEHTGPGPMTGLLERYPRLQLVIAHLGMPEYRDFLDLAARYERVHLDTTMFATDFTEKLMPFDRADLPQLAALRDKVLLGSDFPSIPYPYAHQLAALHRLDLGEEWLRAVLWGNGARLFGLEA